MKITATQARTEIDRRQLAKGDPGRVAGRKQAELDGTFSLGSAELAEIAGPAKVERAKKAAKVAAKAAPKELTVKGECAAHADRSGATKGSAAWWTAYKAGTAWFRAIEAAK